MDSLEQGFLEAIRAQPAERAIRLVYSDWLEERNDPRAELIRLEEAMRQVPIYSDRYWVMKSRRNVLRSESEAAWLELMRHGTDYEPVFGDVPSGWKERWRLIQEFIERWHGIPMGDVGSQLKRVRETEKTVGYAMSPSVREWIALVWDLLDAEKFGSVFRDSLSPGDVRGQDAFGWALEHILTNINIRQSDGYCCRASDPKPLLHQLSDVFTTKAKFDRFYLFESPNIFVFVGPEVSGGTNTEMSVHIWKSIRRQEIPDVIWGFPERRWWTSGIFSPQD